MVEVETFLTHNTFTSLPGGFRIKINGVTIYNVSSLKSLFPYFNFYIRVMKVSFRNGILSVNLIII